MVECANLYSITRSQEAMRRLFRFGRDLTANLPPLPAVYPDTMAPIVHTTRDGERELSMMRWGFSPNLGKALVTNVRNLKSPYWRARLKAEWRCLWPACDEPRAAQKRLEDSAKMAKSPS